VRLHESMLFDPITARIHFCATKFISLVDFEQEKTPMAFFPYVVRTSTKPLAARANASSQVAWRNVPFSRTNGCVIRGKDEDLVPRDRRAAFALVAPWRSCCM
jgi:hypothetical protein